MSIATRRRLLGRPGIGELRLEQLLLAAKEDVVPQYEICGYFVDFALPDEKIAIEVDSKHRYNTRGELRLRKDIRRQVALERAGWRIIRVLNKKVEEVFEKLKKVRAEPYTPLLDFNSPTIPRPEWQGPVYRPLVVKRTR